MADLTTLQAVRLQLGFGDDDIADDDLIETYVSQATTLFETDTRRNFSAANGTLTLDACEPYAYGRKLFFREDVVGVYSVLNGDGTTVTSSQYRLLPYNTAPKYALELTSGSGVYWTYTTDARAAITVAGTLGYSLNANAPADVTLAVTKLAAWLYQNRDNRGEVTRFADGSAVIPANAPQLVLRIRDKYVRDMFTP